MASKYETPSRNVLEISEFCREHKGKFKIYCKNHDCPCCRKCVVSGHNTCQDLIPLEQMVQNVKNSYGFHDIQQTMTDMLDNFKKIKKDRQANVSSLKEERKLIEKEIEQTKITINAYLHKLQKGIMKELYRVESKEIKVIRKLLNSIEKNEKEIIGYQENLVNIKQHASDLQTFLAMKQMDLHVSEKDKYFTSLLTSNKLNRVSLSCKITDTLQNIGKEIKKFGEVIISTSSCELEIVREKEKQAQIVIAPAPSNLIDNISVTLQMTIDTKLNEIRGCTLLPDGKMVFSCYVKDCVRGFNRDGSQDFDICLKPNAAFDVTYIYDINIIAVTGEFTENISIIDVESMKVKETIPLGSYNTGIVSRNNTFIYCAGGFGIQMINLSDKSVSNIVDECLSWYSYVTTFGDKLYYTDNYKNTVTCCDRTGTRQWQFKDESVLRDPQGISVDNAGNVYVVGCSSNNVVVISLDGQKHGQLLSMEDGLDSPQVLHYDRSTNQLLVANQKGKVFLYNLE